MTILLLCVACETSSKDETETDTGTEMETETETEVALYGPENSWFHANASDVPTDLTGTGFSVGGTATISQYKINSVMK